MIGFVSQPQSHAEAAGQGGFIEVIMLGICDTQGVVAACFLHTERKRRRIKAGAEHQQRLRALCASLAGRVGQQLKELFGVSLPILRRLRLEKRKVKIEVQAAMGQRGAHSHAGGEDILVDSKRLGDEPVVQKVADRDRIYLDCVAASMPLAEHRQDIARYKELAVNDGEISWLSARRISGYGGGGRVQHW